MLARTNKISHPLGIQIETPLLVPSFSSKGFGFKPKKKKEDDDVSEVVDALKVSTEFLTESLLVSAYDIFYNHIPFTEEFICTDITLIDSGGYETGGMYDLSTTTKYNYDLKEWNIENLKTILNRFPEHKAAVIVSFDHGNHRISLDEQIKSALELFSAYPKKLGDFLIKPETKGQEYVQMENILAKINKMKKFPIIGATEKELGNSILQRMINISKIRKALDESKNFAPIHVFGSLDPVTSILYFLSGAEIFDGLTWLKYSYFGGAAVYQSNYGALNSDLGIHVKDYQVKSKSTVNNIYYLDKMKYIMKDFIATKNFTLFDQLAYKGFGALIEKSYKTFESNLK